MQSSDILRNNVREKLARDEVVASMTVRLVRAIEIVRIAKTAGFDSLYVDLEHSSLGLGATGQICLAALALDAPKPLAESDAIRGTLTVGQRRLTRRGRVGHS